jgi:hypothetical protein
MSTPTARNLLANQLIRKEKNILGQVAGCFLYFAKMEVSRKRQGSCRSSHRPALHVTLRTWKNLDMRQNLPKNAKLTRPWRVKPHDSNALDEKLKTPESYL